MTKAGWPHESRPGRLFAHPQEAGIGPRARDRGAVSPPGHPCWRALASSPANSTKVVRKALGGRGGPLGGSWGSACNGTHGFGYWASLILQMPPDTKCQMLPPEQSCGIKCTLYNSSDGRMPTGPAPHPHAREGPSSLLSTRKEAAEESRQT